MFPGEVHLLVLLGAGEQVVGIPDTNTCATPVSSHTTHRNPSGLGPTVESQPVRVAGT